MGNKTCIKCGLEKNISEFTKHKTAKDGHLNYCKICRKEQTDLNKLKNEEHYKNYAKKYREDNAIIISEKRKKTYQDNKEYYLTKGAEWRDENRDKIKERNRLKYLNDPDKIKSINKKWADENRVLVNENARKNYQKNVKQWAWRNLLKNSLKRLGQPKEGKTIKLLGYSVSELSKHIETLFTEGMSWDNYGEWHIDHIKRVNDFELDTPPNIVNALSNLQPLWATTREINGIIYEGNLNKG